MTTRMARPRRYAVRTMAIAAAAALAPPATAAKPPKPPQPGFAFAVTLSAERTITWNIPRHTTMSDCARSWWEEGSGEETWQVGSRKDQRVRAVASAGAVQFLYADDADGKPRFWIEAGGSRKRAGRVDKGFEPVGTCSASQQPTPPALPRDCGTRLPEYRIPIYYSKGKVYWTLAPGREEQGKLTFDNCPIFAPDPIATTDWTSITGTASARAFARGQSQTVTATKAYKQAPKKIERGGRLITSAKVTWTIRFTRVR